MRDLLASLALALAVVMELATALDLFAAPPLDGLSQEAPRSGGARTAWGLNTSEALALASAGSALLMARTWSLAQTALGAFVGLLGCMGLFGYALQSEAHPSSLEILGMSPVAAASYLVLGLGLVFHGARRRKATRLDTSWRGPFIGGLSVGLAVLFLWGALLARERSQLERLLASAVERASAEIDARFGARLDALGLLAAEWEARGIPSPSARATDARLLIAHYSGLHAVEWVEPDGQERWIFPDNAQMPDFDLGARGTPATLGETRTTGRRVSVGLARFPDGSLGFRVSAPIFESDRFAGWLSGVFRSAELFEQVLANAIAPHYGLSVGIGGAELYRRENPLDDGSRAHIQATRLEVAEGMFLQIAMWPSGPAAPGDSSPLPIVMLGTGVLLAMLFTAALRLGGIVSARAQQVEAASRALTEEIEARRSADAEVRKLNVELEERVQQRTRELARSAEDLKQFASFLSHELRQPINALTLWADLLESAYGETLDGKGQQYISEVRIATTRIADLIRGQLALSAVSADEAEVEAVDLAEVVSQVVARLGSELQEIQGQFDCDELPVVRGVRVQLTQLFTNLIENSIKYRRPEEPLRVRITANPRTSPGESHWEIRVSDNGRGFPTEEAKTIFRIHHQVEAGKPGTGLGLAICKRIVELHGGTISACGEPGNGATFAMTFPAARDAEGRLP
jgi:signal transduction histidine kinase